MLAKTVNLYCVCPNFQLSKLYFHIILINNFNNLVQEAKPSELLCCDLRIYSDKNYYNKRLAKIFTKRPRKYSKLTQFEMNFLLQTILG